MKLKSEFIGVIAASALVLTPVFANTEHSSQGASQESGSQSHHGNKKGPDAQGSAQQGSAQHSGNAANDPDTVRKVQEALNKKGYNVGEADGKLGQKTQDALSQFQQAQGLQPSGQLDEQTLVVLEIAPAVGAGETGGSASGNTSGNSGSSSSGSSSSDQPSSGGSSSGGSSSSSSDQPSTGGSSSGGSY